MARRRKSSARSRRSRTYTTQYRRRYTRSTRGARQRQVELFRDASRILDEHLDTIVARLGLSYLNLSSEEYRTILKPIIEGIISSSEDGVSLDHLLYRLDSSKQQLYVMVAAYLLENKHSLSDEQLEFIVSYGGPVAASHAPKLYKLLVKRGRVDLIPLLQSTWEVYGKPTNVTCPYCGFRAVTPSLECIICGREVKEKDLKKVIDFETRLIEAAENWSTWELKETIERGYVYLSDEIKPATATPSPMDIEIMLSSDERNLLRKILAEKEGR